jgi:hypothetical protein
MADGRPAAATTSAVSTKPPLGVSRWNAPFAAERAFMSGCHSLPASCECDQCSGLRGWREAGGWTNARAGIDACRGGWVAVGLDDGQVTAVLLRADLAEMVAGCPMRW